MSLTKVTYSMIDGAAANVKDFGAVGNGTTDDTEAIQAAIDSGAKRIIFPEGTYYLPAGAQTVQAYAIAEGDATIDLPVPYAVMVSGKTNMVIDASGASFVTNYGNPFCFYRCVSSNFIGGSFTRNGSDAEVDANQTVAVQFVRSVDCDGSNIRVDGHYRNLTAYRAMNCGFMSCYSINARYANYYVSSTIDITIDGVAAGKTTRQYVKDSYARGATLCNVFAENADVVGNYLYDLTGFVSGGDTVGSHILCQFDGNYSAVNNFIFESSNSNSNLLSGISAVASLTYITASGPLKNIEIVGNVIFGGYKGIVLSGIDGCLVSNNYLRNYYQTGVSLLTNVTDGQNYTIDNVVIDGNLIANMNDSSTRTNTGNDKNAGLQVEENDAIQITNVLVDGNVVDAKGGNTTKTPSFGVYVETNKANTSSVQFDRNALKTNVTNSWVGAINPFSQNKNISTGANTGVSIVEYGDGFNHRTELALTNAVLNAITGGAAQGVSDLIYTFPAGAIIVESAYMSVSITQTQGNITADTPEVGLGTASATGGISTLSGAQENIIEAAVAADCNGTATVKTAAPTGGSPLIINAGDSHAVSFNAADTWAASGDTGALLNGTVIINWKFIS